MIAKDAFGPDVFRGVFEVSREDQVGGIEKILTRLEGSVKTGRGEIDDDGKKKAGDMAEAVRARSMLIVLREDADVVKLLLPLAHQWLLDGKMLAYETRTALAVLARQVTRQLDVAEVLYRSCLDQPGGPRDAEQDVYIGLLRVLWQARKHEAVVAICKRGLKNAEITSRVLFHVEMAQSLMALGRVKESLAAADDAVKEARESDRLMCRRVRAELLAQGEQCDKAIAECQEMLKEYNLAGDARDIRRTLSGIYSTAHNHDAAEVELKKILEDDPNDATANNDLGYQWADQNKNLEEAEKLIRKALELDQRQRNTGTQITPDADQDNAAYVDSLGWVLFRRGRFQDAARELERATQAAGRLTIR